MLNNLYSHSTIKIHNIVNTNQLKHLLLSLYLRKISTKVPKTGRVLNKLNNILQNQAHIFASNTQFIHISKNQPNLPITRSTRQQHFAHTFCSFAQPEPTPAPTSSLSIQPHRRQRKRTKDKNCRPTRTQTMISLTHGSL